MKLPRFPLIAVPLLALLLQTALPAGAQVVRPRELNVQYNRAETAWKSGASMLEVKARLDRVLKALPDDVDARKLRAQVHMALDRPEEALLDARHAARMAPADGEAHLILAEVARLTGDRETATRALDEASERVLDDAAFHLRLAWNAAHLGLLDKAEAFARIALALDAQSAPAHYQLARVFVEKGQVDAAAAVLARGFRNAVVDPAVIEKDSLLARVAGHPDVAEWLRR